MAVEALLFQAGYLTIKSSHTDDLNGGTRYRLGYPNREVRQSLNESLLAALTPNAAQLAGSPRLRELLAANDFDGIEALLRPTSTASPANGTPGTTSPATRATTPACSTPASRRSDSTSSPRTAAPAAVPT